MHTLSSKNSRPVALFNDMFGEHLAADDYMEFYSNRKKAGTDTSLTLDIYKARKLSTIVVEEYAVRGKLRGHVISVMPDPQYDVPIFMFQLGGNATQSIALLDISPTLPSTSLAPLRPAFEKYRRLLGIGDSPIDWVAEISSPYLLHCQYGSLDIDRFMEATREYLRIWIEAYYLPGAVLSSEEQVEVATRAIRRYKQAVFDNDPAHGIFSKAWGRQVADAMMYLENRDHPALAIAL